ncbi:MAG: penicillin-binding protein 2 [Aggregatilineales bacterium]
MATQTPQYSMQQDMVRRRIPLLTAGILVVCLGLLLRVIWLQFPQDQRVAREFAAQREASSGRTQRVETERGVIYDRNGNRFAVNTVQYRVGVNPPLVADARGLANQLATILNRDPLQLYNLLISDTQWQFIGVVDPDTWRQISDIDSFAIDAERVYRRFYPQGSLASHVLGFVAGTGADASGYNGVEGQRNDLLSGEIEDQEVSTIPFGLPEDFAALGTGADLVLTIDRDIQFLIETELQLAIDSTGSIGGTIIVMNPRNGDILGMANYPTFDPNFYDQVQDERVYNNPAVSSVFEPGSIFKVLTVAAALELGAVTPDWSYYDNGRMDDIGSVTIQNWDRRAWGTTDLQTVLVSSLNVGTATISREISRQFGVATFYQMLERFGIGSPTLVDLQGEVSGNLRIPGDELWSESDLLTNSFGQGVSVTPLQMLTAVNAIANDGLMMQPRIIFQRIDGEEVTNASTSVLGSPISAQTANIVTDMMVATVRDGFDASAQLPGYTVAGKTGTAEIADVLGYRSDAWIMSFIGFLPADDPQLSILIKLDEPQGVQWASQVAAPVFRRLAERLVILMEIPPDDVRMSINQQASVGQ